MSGAGMSAPEAEETSSPFSRPGFVVSAVVVAVVLVLGVVVAIVAATRGDDDPVEGPAGRTPTARAGPTAGAADGSVCGLTDSSDTTLTQAPEATWEYQGTTAYPTSAEFGPGAAEEAGYRYCFARSPQGALFMAANAVAQGGSFSDPTVAAFAEYALADGPYREELLTPPTDGASTGDGGTRMRIAGFRVLHYDGDTARIDMGIRATSQGQTLTASAVYELVWSAGDWKFRADLPTPVDMAPVPDLVGYVPWGE